MFTKALLICLVIGTAAQDKGTAASLMDDSEAALAPRIVIGTKNELWSFVKDGENGNAVVGCFNVDEEGGVVGRNDTNSHYGVFRESSVKNKDVPFGIIKDTALMAELGIDQKRLPVMLNMHHDEGASQIEFRKSQFFEDHTVYFSEDRMRVIAYWKKDSLTGQYSLKDMRPKNKNPNAPKKEPLV